jgi:hypothetical protein
VCNLLWMLSEVSIVALDLTMVLGTAIGLNLLFQLPLLPSILLTGAALGLTGVDQLQHQLRGARLGMRCRAGEHLHCNVYTPHSIGKRPHVIRPMKAAWSHATRNVTFRARRDNMSQP